MTDLKQTPSVDWMDAPIKASKWKNFHFDKNGNTYVSKITFASSAGALKRSQNHYKSGYTKFNTLNGVLENKDYSHTLQLPWKE